jgi:LacI family transcriptional regulator
VATLVDIARKANVSKVTVSRVLNRDQSLSVSEETRQRIFSIAEEFQYKTPRERKGKNAFVNNGNARIGTVLFLTEQQEEGDNYFRSIREGIEKECMAGGIKATNVFRFPQDINSEVVISDVDGAIVIGSSFDNFNAVVNQKRHIVFVDYSPDVERVDSVVIDFERATRLVLEHLMKAGHQEIGYMGGGKRFGKDERHHFYEMIMKEKDLFQPKHVHIRDWTTQDGYVSMQRLIKKGDLPTAFFFGNDSLAIGALRALHEAGIRVPQDMAIVGFDDFPMSAFVNPALTTVKVHSELMGRMAVKLLLDRMNGREIPVQVTVPVKLIIRDSCGAGARLSSM